MFDIEMKYTDFSNADTDMVAWLNEAKRKCFIDALVSGNFHPNIHRDIQEFFLRSTNLLPDQYNYYSDIGGWILEDRRWRAMTPEEQAEERRLDAETEMAAMEMLANDPDLARDVKELNEGIDQRIREANNTRNLFDAITMYMENENNDK